MKLGEAQKVVSAHLNILSRKKSTFTKLLNNEQSTSLSLDRVEISKKLSAVEQEYNQIEKIAQRLSTLDSDIQNTEIARQQSEAIKEAVEELMKILTVFRRIAKGDQVPALDEKKLMEYSHEMYMAAKNMALMAQSGERKEHKSLWEEPSNEEGNSVDPAELAANTEVDLAFPDMSPSPDAAAQPTVPE